MKIFLCFLLIFSSALFGDDAFSQAQEEVKKAPYWVYPYPRLVDQLRAEGKTSLLIFGYGSLMDAASAGRTLGKASLETMRPGVAFGIRRLFNRDVPLHKNSKWDMPCDPRARGMLNVLPSEFPQDFVNGVLIDVTLEDVPNIVARERGYDLLPVVVQNWNNVADLVPRYEIAYTFYTPPSSGATNSIILPRPGYYELTRRAAMPYGRLFYQIWLKTTYLADGVTPITEWEQKID